MLPRMLIKHGELSDQVVWLMKPHRHKPVTKIGLTNVKKKKKFHRLK